MASSRWPVGWSCLQLCNSHVTCAGAIAFGTVAKRQSATAGRAAARSALMSPRWTRKRHKVRRALTMDWA